MGWWSQECKRELSAEVFVVFLACASRRIEVQLTEYDILRKEKQFLEGRRESKFGPWSREACIPPKGPN